MRPIKLGPYSPVTAVTTGFATALTGAGPFTPTSTSCSDGLSHLVTLTSAADLHAITVTLTGTDSSGNPLTESLAGPAATTTTSTKHFLTLTAVAVSATLGANTMDVGYSANSVTPAIPLDRRSPAQAAMSVVATGTINFNIDRTLGDIFSYSAEALPWDNIADSLIANVATDLGIGSAATRLHIASVTNGATLTVYISQASGFVV